MYLFFEIFLLHVVHLSYATMTADVMAAKEVLANVFLVISVNPQIILFAFVADGRCCETIGKDEGNLTKPLFFL